MADVVGTALLVLVVCCALKIHIQAVVVVGIVGLAWIGLALYNTLTSLTQS
jgi:hypothetical protein